MEKFTKVERRDLDKSLHLSSSLRGKSKNITDLFDRGKTEKELNNLR